MKGIGKALVILLALVVAGLTIVPTAIDVMRSSEERPKTSAAARPAPPPLRPPTILPSTTTASGGITIHVPATTGSIHSAPIAIPVPLVVEDAILAGLVTSGRAAEWAASSPAAPPSAAAPHSVAPADRPAAILTIADAAAAEAPATVETAMIAIAADLRDGPFDSARVAGTVPAATSVVVERRLIGWLQVRAVDTGLTGWVAATDFARAEGSNPGPAAVALADAPVLRLSAP